MHTPLDITNTPQCQPHPWHPSVVFVAEGWNGHRYWMAQTPFPPMNVAPYRDRYELPCIHFSDDGIHWKAIEENPIVELSEEEIDAHNYYSDPHLMLKDGVLECYYRFSMLQNRQLEGNKTLLLKKTSIDGLHWSGQRVIADLRTKKDVDIWGEQIISQSVVWDGRLYQCWYVDRSSYLQNRIILCTNSYDGVEWQRYKECTIDDPTIDPWHIDVQYYDGKYQMIIYDMWQLWWFESDDGLHFRKVSQILQPTQYFMDFYSEGLYRACSAKTDEGIRLYFSAKQKKHSFIGLLETKDRNTFFPVNGMGQMRYLRNHIIPQLSRRNVKRFIKHSYKAFVKK